MSTKTDDVKSSVHDMDELEFIRAAETTRRTELLMKRDGISENNARKKASEWIQSEIENHRAAIGSDWPEKNVYKVYYRRYSDDRNDNYRLANVITKGVLYDWRSSHKILAQIIKERLDPDCKIVVVFHLDTGHEIDLENHEFNNEESTNNLDELSKQRRICQLEEQIRKLRN